MIFENRIFRYESLQPSMISRVNDAVSSTIQKENQTYPSTSLQECINIPNVCVNFLNVYVNFLNVYVNFLKVYVNILNVCVNFLKVYVNFSNVYVNISNVYANFLNVYAFVSYLSMDDGREWVLTMNYRNANN